LGVCEPVERRASSIRTQLAWRCQHGTWLAEGATSYYRVEPTGLVAGWFSVMCYDHYGTPWRRETTRGTTAAKALANSWENDARRTDAL
jgi:hypothetical protein